MTESDLPSLNRPCQFPGYRIIGNAAQSSRGWELTLGPVKLDIPIMFAPTTFLFRARLNLQSTLLPMATTNP